MAIRTPTEAVAYAMAHLTSGYNGMCLAHVQDAYGAVPIEPSAISAWTNSKWKHPTTDLASAPYGAPIYWSQPGNPYGHIALHLDGDRMYTTDSGAGHPHTASISDWQHRYGYQPLGWTEDIENQPIPGLSKGDDMAVKTDAINWDGQNVTVEYALQDLKHKIEALGNRLGPVSDKYPFDYLPAILNNTNSLYTQVAALATAVDTLSKSMGADPEQIAQAVQQAVRDTLDSLEITITATDGTDQ